MLDSIAYTCLTAVLIVAAITDWRTGLVYNWLTLPTMLFGLLLWAIGGMVIGGTSQASVFLGHAFIALLVGLVPMIILVFATGSLGMGDAKLLGAVGALSASVPVVFYTFAYGLILAVCMAIFTMARYGMFRETLTRIALLLATREPLPDPNVQNDSEQTTPTIAFSVALAGGGIIAGLEFMLDIPMPWTGLV